MFLRVAAFKSRAPNSILTAFPPFVRRTEKKRWFLAPTGSLRDNAGARAQEHWCENMAPYDTLRAGESREHPPLVLRTFLISLTPRTFLRPAGVTRLHGLLEIKDTHRPYGGPMLLGIDRPTVGPYGVARHQLRVNQCTGVPRS